VHSTVTVLDSVHYWSRLPAHNLFLLITSHHITKFSLQ